MFVKFSHFLFCGFCSYPSFHWLVKGHGSTESHSGTEPELCRHWWWPESPPLPSLQGRECGVSGGWILGHWEDFTLSNLGVLLTLCLDLYKMSCLSWVLFLF